MGPGEDHKGHRGHSPGVQVQGRATPSVANSPQALGRPLSTLSPKRKSFCNLLPLAWPLEWPEEESQRSRGTASSRRGQGADPSGTSSAVGAPLPTGAPRRERRAVAGEGWAPCLQSNPSSQYLHTGQAHLPPQPAPSAHLPHAPTPRSTSRLSDHPRPQGRHLMTIATCAVAG